MYKNSLFFIFIHAIALNGCSSHGAYQEIRQVTLDSGWTFHEGDNLSYAQNIFNDSSWSPIKPSSSWQQQGHIVGGFAWYRNRVHIPLYLKRNLSDSIVFNLGVIKECDQIFLNGKLIGENGRNITEDTVIDSAFIYGGSSSIRKYTVNVHDPKILWGKENLIAIRVFEKGGRGGGGLVSGIPFVCEASIFDSLLIDRRFYRYGRNTSFADTVLTITNASSQQIIGSVQLEATTEASKIFLRENISFSLKSHDTLKVPMSLPGTLDQTKVSLKFENHITKRSKRDSLIIPFILFK